jgi:hypothetical protein
LTTPKEFGTLEIVSFQRFYDLSTQTAGIKTLGRTTCLDLFLHEPVTFLEIATTFKYSVWCGCFDGIKGSLSATTVTYGNLSPEHSLFLGYKR